MNKKLICFILSVCDTHLGGYEVPSGTMVSIAISSINRDPSIWDEPTVFNPDRFLKTKSDGHQTCINPSAFKWIPFSAGERRCLGDRFSLLEQKAFLMQLLTRYELLGDGKAEKDEDIARAKGNLEILFNQPKSIKLRLGKLE